MTETGGWDAFCDKHFEEAFEHIKNKYKDYSVGWIRFKPCEDEKDTLCGFPGCTTYPTKEIVWIRVSKDMTSEYKSLR